MLVRLALLHRVQVRPHEGGLQAAHELLGVDHALAPAAQHAHDVAPHGLLLHAAGQGAVALLQGLEDLGKAPLDLPSEGRGVADARLGVVPAGQGHVRPTITRRKRPPTG